MSPAPAATSTKTPVQGTASPKNLREILQVKPPSEYVEWLNLLVYGEPGAGKTFLAGTADDEPETKPVLFLDVEGGIATIRDRPGIDVISIRSAPDLNRAYERLFEHRDNLPYRTVVIDSLTELADVDMRNIMQLAYNRNPDRVDKDVPSPREWGITRNHIRTLVRDFRDLPCHVIFTASLGQTQEEGQPTKYHPGFGGKLRSEVPGFVDIVGYLYTEVSARGVIERKLQVQGSRRVVGKDRTSRLGDILVNPTIPQMWSLLNAPTA